MIKKSAATFLLPCFILFLSCGEDNGLSGDTALEEVIRPEERDQW